ncbi:MAG: toll/interleukin-1 receptor domain-containing protein [Verrucomicrobiales bacterium]|nr:toll/interleukin-1 receptor domain-containing protein [Verrucomicrobiales bacterium]
MPLPDSFTAQEVNDAIADLKACIDDATEGGSFKELEKHLPRFSHIFRHNPVLVQLLSSLPKADIQNLLACAQIKWMSDREKEFPIDPKARMSKQIAILIAIGEQKLNLWDFSELFFGHNNGGNFWQEIFYPATRDILRHAVSLQRDFSERKKQNNSVQRQKLNTIMNYSLDLFISHSSKDKQSAKALVEFLCVALAIPHDRVRCTSVDGYKLSAGVKTEAILRKEIQDACCFIGLITPASLKSQFALFEWGARWGSDEHFVPLLASGLKASVLRPPLSSLNALNCASKSEMEQLVHDLAKKLKKSVALPTIYKVQLAALLKIKKGH